MPRSRHPRARSRTIGLLATCCGIAVAWPAYPQTPEKTAAPVLFTDITAKAGIDFVQTIGDDHMTNIVESAGVGCGFLDYDNDGWIDIYLVNGCWVKGLSNDKLEPEKIKRLSAATDKLYRNRGDGTFEDVTVKAGLARPAYGMGITVADYNGDGAVDIYRTNYGANRLYRNNKDGTFTDVAKAAGVADTDFGVGAAFFDYDRDGRLDLYVGNYVQYDPDYKQYYAPDGFPGPLAYTGQQDRLFHGQSDGTFKDVTDQAGIKITPHGRAMGIGAFDYDGDGLTDVLVSNDAMENFLLRNHGNGTFSNEALMQGVAFGKNGDATAAMGVEIADYDGDGLFDVFVPDMRFSCLYHNLGGGVFEDHAARTGVAAVMGQYVGWGGVFADFDLDGQLDLYVSNGDAHHLEPHEDVVFIGTGDGKFADVSETAGSWMKEKRVGRGVAGADIDNDGDIDVLVTNLNDRPALLRNDTARTGRHWLRVALLGQPPNLDAIGAVVRVTVGDKQLARYRLSGGGYLSQHESRLHFGLGKHDKVDRVEVIWPDGTRSVAMNVPADKVKVIRQKKAKRMPE